MLTWSSGDSGTATYGLYSKIMYFFKTILISGVVISIIGLLLYGGSAMFGNSSNEYRGLDQEWKSSTRKKIARLEDENERLGGENYLLRRDFKELQLEFKEMVKEVKKLRDVTGLNLEEKLEAAREETMDEAVF